MCLGLKVSDSVIFKPSTNLANLGISVWCPLYGLPEGRGWILNPLCGFPHLDTIKVMSHFTRLFVVVSRRLPASAGKVRFGSGSEPLALNTEPELGVRFRPPPNLEPERAFRFGSGSNAVRT